MEVETRFSKSIALDEMVCSAVLEAALTAHRSFVSLLLLKEVCGLVEILDVDGFGLLLRKSLWVILFVLCLIGDIGYSLLYLTF
nr:phosphopantothenoylcysteine decarboxylase subunit VHS3-like isoform X2 [Ipomoea batatas]